MKPSLEEMMRRAHDPREYHRLPGLYRRWDLEAILEAGFEFYIEAQGQDSFGTDLFAVYRRKPAEEIMP